MLITKRMNELIPRELDLREEKRVIPRPLDQEKRWGLDSGRRTGVQKQPLGLVGQA